MVEAEGEGASWEGEEGCRGVRGMDAEIPYGDSAEGLQGFWEILPVIIDGENPRRAQSFRGLASERSQGVRSLRPIRGFTDCFVPSYVLYRCGIVLPQSDSQGYLERVSGHLARCVRGLPCQDLGVGAEIWGNVVPCYGEVGRLCW